MTDEVKTEHEESATATETPPIDASSEAEDTPADEVLTKLHQEVETRDVGPCKKYIKVTIAADDVRKALDEKFSELRVEANVPGFRPGKTPRKVIERRFAKEVESDVKGQMILASLEQLTQEHDIVPLSMPNIDPGKVEIPTDGPMVYEFEVEVRPSFDLPEYKGIKLRRPIKEFTDADVEEEERRVLAPYGQLIPKEDGRVEIGDYVIADIHAKVADRVITDLKEIKVRVDPQLAFKDGVAKKFGEELKGAKSGDVRDVEITLSEAAADPSLRSYSLPSQFTIKEVKMMRLPELTHEFLHGFNVHTPEQLRERIRVLLQRRLEYHQRQSIRQQVLQKIAESSEWDLPRDTVMRQARRAFDRRVMDMRSSGMSEDDIRGRQRVLEQDVLRNAEMTLKEYFVFNKIAEVEKIEVDDDEIYDEIERLADQHNESPRRLRARMEKDDLIEVLAIELTERKVLDMILDSAIYEDVPLGQEHEAPAVATIEEQAVPGEMHDLTAPPPEEKAEEEETDEKEEK